MLCSRPSVCATHGYAGSYSLHVFYHLQAEFEAVFQPYGEDGVTFHYLRSFGLVKVVFTTPEQAALAQSNLCNHEFKGVNLKVKPIKVSYKSGC